MSIYADLQAYFQVQPDRRGWCHIVCPFCGKGNRHCAFSKHGFRCLFCGAHGSLTRLAQRVHLATDADWAPKPRQIPPPVIPWQANAVERIARAMCHPERIARWSAYKPLNVETLDKHCFGYGRLPFRGKNGRWYESKTEWLIVPLFENGVIVGLRGRNVGNEGPKWISATGTRYVLWGIDYVRSEAPVWVCENYVDAAWLMQEHPDMCAVALGGATTWRSEWADQLAARRPGPIVVALDNDLAGQAQGALYETLRAQWRAEHPDLVEPTWLNGPRIANDLLAHGLTVRLFRWPPHAPAKAGVDWLLMQERIST